MEILCDICGLYGIVYSFHLIVFIVLLIARLGRNASGIILYGPYIVFIVSADRGGMLVV